MHSTAFENCTLFYTQYIEPASAPITVVEFGSYNVNGTLRPIFGNAKYIGIDMPAGPGVLS